MQKKRVVIAGQTPPPQGGQNIMIAQILSQLGREDRFETVHWAFFFSRDLTTLRRVELAKLLELLRCWWRLLRIRMSGPIDLLLYPAAGPHLVPILRDICLLPWARLVSRKLVIQFHAAGIGEKLKKPNLVLRVLKVIMRTADSAIVMTNYNRVDPEAVGVSEIDVLPHRIPDEFRTEWSQPDANRLLYLGHLSHDKGTPQLLTAFAAIARDYPDLQLELVGETLAPYAADTLKSDIARLGIGPKVRLSGVLTGEAKWRAYGRSGLFVFPTIAPFESFGLVLIEAMMYGLPIVATDWRGNRDVLDDFGGVLFAPNEPLAQSIESGLRKAIEVRGQWLGWGQRNRQNFLSRFLLSETHSDYVDLVRQAVERPHAKA